MEEWRTIPICPKYEVSSLGRVRHSVRKIPIKLYLNKGYLNFNCHMDDTKKYKTFLVHQCVCHAFHGPRTEEKPWALHNDDNPLNNAESNLHWGTMLENNQTPANRSRTSAALKGRPSNFKGKVSPFRGVPNHLRGRHDS